MVTPEQSPVPEAQAVQNPEPEKGEVADRAQLEKMREENRRQRMEYLAKIDPSLPNQVESWKAKFPRIESIHVLGQLYIWRGMSRSEYIALMGQGQEKIKNEEAICTKCILYPPPNELDWVQLPAGLPTTLSDHILSTSGFGAEDPVPVRL